MHNNELINLHLRAARIDGRQINKLRMNAQWADLFDFQMRMYCI